jgi:hypothetical protein
MNALRHTEVLAQTDQVKEHRGYPRLGSLPQEDCFSEPGRHGSPDRPDVPDEEDFPTFIHGAGI